MSLCHSWRDNFFEEKFGWGTKESGEWTRIGQTFARREGEIEPALIDLRPVKVNRILSKSRNVNIRKQHYSQPADGCLAGKEQIDSTGWKQKRAGKISNYWHSFILQGKQQLHGEGNWKIGLTTPLKEYQYWIFHQGAFEAKEECWG